MTGRSHGDSPGTMSAVSVLKAGEASYFKTNGGTKYRWGDYSATSVDPADDRTMWTLQEYAARKQGSDRWATWCPRCRCRCTTDAECDDGNECTTDACTVATGNCAMTAELAPSCRAPVVAQKSSVLLKNKAVDSKDALTWNWMKGAATSTSDFGDPLNTTNS